MRITDYMDYAYIDCRLFKLTKERGDELQELVINKALEKSEAGSDKYTLIGLIKLILEDVEFNSFNEMLYAICLLELNAKEILSKAVTVKKIRENEKRTEEERKLYEIVTEEKSIAGKTVRINRVFMLDKGFSEYIEHVV